MKTLGIILLIPIIAMSAQWETFPLRENGTIPVWTVAGPFPNGKPTMHGDGCFGYFNDYLTAMGGEKNAIPGAGDLVPVEDGKQIVWQTAYSNPIGVLDYIDIFAVAKETPAVAYAFCNLVTTRQQNVLLKIRSNDGVRVWLNHQMIHDHHVGRTVESQEDRVPVLLKPGKNPLLVKVDQGGGNWGLAVAVVTSGNSPVQGITTEVSLTEPLKGKLKTITLTSTPVIENTPEGPRQVITAEIFSGGLKNLVCHISKAEWSKPREIRLKNVPPGKQHVQLKVPVITVTGPARVMIQTAHEKIELPEVTLEQAREWLIYFVQHVHTDIGYTRPQTEILPEHLRFIDYALDFCDLTDHYPDDARFRWTCEVTWPVREYLKRRPKDQVERLVKRLAEGRIEIAGMFLNMSEIATEDALAASLQPIREFNRLNLPVTTAMQNDVNGIGWCLVDYFSAIGVKYLTMGINKTRSILPFDRPTAFWWESPSGKRLLAFRADHYHVANYWHIHTANLPAFELGLLEHLNFLEANNYPFDRIAIQFSGYHTDNSPPSTTACDLVKAWNEKYLWPRLRIATVNEFLQYVETNHGNQLPVYRAAWPDWWTDGFGSAARETAEARKIHNSIQITQGLLAIAALLGAPIAPATMERVASVQDALLFYDEHTFGAAESIGDPMAENSMVQWGEKSSYIWEAVKNEGLLREEALGLLQSFLPRTTTPTIAVFNTLNWPRSGLVELFIDHEILPADADFAIVDCETGTEIPAQAIKSRTEGTYWALWPQNIPPLGYRTFRIKVTGVKPKQLNQHEFQISSLENSFYRVELNTQTGSITRLYDKVMQQELVDPGCVWDLGQFIYEKLTEGRDFVKDHFNRSSLTDVKIQAGSSGPIWKSVNISANANGCDRPDGVKIDIRLFDPEKRIELHFNIRKQRIADAEACYVAFPFNLPGGKIYYEAQGGLVTPGQTQLPGSASDWHTVQNFMAIRNNTMQVILGSNQIPLVQFGDINLGKWQYILNIEKPHIFSWVMNNYWFTNFRAFQEGEFQWSYYLTSTPDTTNLAATRFGWDSAMPLVPRVLPPGDNKKSGKLSLSTLELNCPNVVLVTARPSYVDGSLVLHLREVAGKTTTISFKDEIKINKSVSVDEINVLEQPLRKNVAEIAFEPFAVKFIKIGLQ